MLKNPVQNNSQQNIVTLLQHKDIKGIDALYDQYGSYIYGFIIKIVKLDDVAENVLQDTFLKVWNKIDSFNIEKGRFVTWVINIARNTAIDTIRSKHYKQSLKLISLEHAPQRIEYSTKIKVDNLDIKDIVGKLDKKYSEIIHLVYFKGYTHAEASKKLQIPLGTVKSRVRKAFSDLKIILQE